MRKFITRISLIDLGLLIVASWPILHFWDSDVLIAAVAGLVFMGLAAIFTFWITERNQHKSMNQFMIAVFGSMGIKIVVVLAVIAAVFLLDLLHIVAFAIGVLVSYAYKSAIEIHLLVQKMKPGEQAQPNETNT